MVTWLETGDIKKTEQVIFVESVTSAKVKTL